MKKERFVLLNIKLLLQNVYLQNNKLIKFIKRQDT